MNFLKSLRNLRLGTKIGIVIAIMMAPLALMTTLFVAQVQKDASFSSLELDGSRYIRPVWDAVVKVAGPGSAAETASRIKQEGVLYDEAMKTAEPVKAFLSKSDGSAPVVDAVAAGQTAILKIGDGSNLTLDPDLDSYYTMDVVTNRAPETIGALVGLRAALAPFEDPAAKPGFAEFAAFIQATTRFAAATDAVKSSTRSAFDGNADGSLKKTLQGASDSFAARVDALVALTTEVQTRVENQRPTADLKQKLVQADAALLQDLNTFWIGSHAELERLLTVRIAGIWSGGILRLVLAGIGTLMALFVAFYFVRSIRGPLSEVVEVLKSFQQGEFGMVVPYVEDRNEVGDIARALRRFQHLGAQQALTMAAMDGSDTMLMITDPDERVVFMSGTLVQLFMSLEPIFREARHDFSVEKLYGAHTDYYGHNGALERKLISDDGKVRVQRLKVGDVMIHVDMNYIFDKSGQKIGHTLLWHNITADLDAQAEVAMVVDAAARGDFSKRIPLDNKRGFVRDVADGLNRISVLMGDCMREFSEVMAAVAAGDLTRDVETRYEGLLGELQEGINDTVAKLAETVATIQSTASDVAVAAQEINSGANDLARRTEEQASALEQTASTTEQLAASVKSSSMSSREAVSMAEEAMTVARTGGGIVRDAVDAMSRIEQASQKISDITGVIDEIAFQTNLLALNASVEAARAGDAGKGFAVVAAEVRTLAQRSSEAAKDITGLIQTSVNEVSQGVKLVREAGDVLGRIVEASSRVASTVTDVSTAAVEQASGIDEMSQAVSHMDDMTQQNAALAEESAASAGALASRIENLNELVAMFQTRAHQNQGSWTSGQDSEPVRRRA